MNPLITKEFLEEQGQPVGEERFQQEHEASFVDDGWGTLEDAYHLVCERVQP